VKFQCKQYMYLFFVMSVRSVQKVGGSNPRSGQFKDWKIGAYCFPG